MSDPKKTFVSSFSIKVSPNKSNRSSAHKLQPNVSPIPNSESKSNNLEKNNEIIRENRVHKAPMPLPRTDVNQCKVSKAENYRSFSDAEKQLKREFEEENCDYEKCFQNKADSVVQIAHRATSEQRITNQTVQNFAHESEYVTENKVMATQREVQQSFHTASNKQAFMEYSSTDCQKVVPFEYMTENKVTASQEQKSSNVAFNKQACVEYTFTDGQQVAPPNIEHDSTDFVYPPPPVVQTRAELASVDNEQSNVISIFRGSVKLKSKAFESDNSVRYFEKYGLNSHAGTRDGNDLPVVLGGVVQNSVTALQHHRHTEPHESQIIGDDAHSVDGHVKVKQNLFETLPVDALYEHGATHSSQVVIKGRKKSNLGSVLNEFNTKPLSDINKKDLSEPTSSAEILEIDVSEKISSFKTFEECRFRKHSNVHESQKVDGDIPHNSEIVRMNAERFENENFCQESNLHSSQIVKEEGQELMSCRQLHSFKGDFESKPLDFIGAEERPARHPSQIIEMDHQQQGRISQMESEFSLSEPHPSQRINYHEQQFTGITQVKEKRRHFYDYGNCKDVTGYASREMLEDSEILNSPEITGIVRNTASMYLDEHSFHKASSSQNQFIGCNDEYVKPLKNKFETRTLSELAETSNLHPSQCVDMGSAGLSEETQQCHRKTSLDRSILHASQVIDPNEYSTIKSDVGAKTYAFMITPLSQLATHSDDSDVAEECGVSMSSAEVRSKAATFESQHVCNKGTLHQSQIVGHDFHLILAGQEQGDQETEELLPLHSSQRVNHGISQPQPRLRKPGVSYMTEGILSSEDTVPEHHDYIGNLNSDQTRTSNTQHIKDQNLPKTKSIEMHDEDLELLLNYAPAVKQEMPSMVTVLTKGVPTDLIKSGHPMITEYVDSKRPMRKISSSSRSPTPQRRISQCTAENYSNSRQSTPIYHSEPTDLTKSDQSSATEYVDSKRPMRKISSSSRSSTPQRRISQCVAENYSNSRQSTPILHSEIFPIKSCDSSPLPMYPEAPIAECDGDQLDEPLPPPPEIDDVDFEAQEAFDAFRSIQESYKTATPTHPDFVEIKEPFTTISDSVGSSSKLDDFNRTPHEIIDYNPCNNFVECEPQTYDTFPANPESTDYDPGNDFVQYSPNVNLPSTSVDYLPRNKFLENVMNIDGSRTDTPNSTDYISQDDFVQYDSSAEDSNSNQSLARYIPSKKLLECTSDTDGSRPSSSGRTSQAYFDCEDYLEPSSSNQATAPYKLRNKLVENVSDAFDCRPSTPRFKNFSQPPDFVTAMPGSTLAEELPVHNMILLADGELPFLVVDQENSSREEFSKKMSHMTSSAESSSFLRIQDDEMNRKTSTVTVESYQDSDD